MATCVSGKKMYPSLEIAEDVLIELWTRFDYTMQNGPVNVYQCEDCGYYHLTSKGTMNERLARNIRDGKISLQKEANRWMNKMKKK